MHAAPTMKMKLARRAHAGIEVAHDRARQYDRARAADTLKETRSDQRVDRLRHRADKRADDIERKRGQQDRPTAITIRQRTIEHLADGEPDQVARNRQLYARRRRRQHMGNIRQRRQIHIHRHRPKRGQHGQQQSECEGPGLEHCKDPHTAALRFDRSGPNRSSGPYSSPCRRRELGSLPLPMVPRSSTGLAFNKTNFPKRRAFSGWRFRL
jgi:hypothetical protein